MLRNQGAFDPMDFLAGTGEMAQRIRTFDWKNHPFGPPETWSQTLRSALAICLHSAFPTAIYWGRDLRLFYNDAWSPIPGPRHPGALGARAQDVWSDIWHIIEPQFMELIRSGEGLFLREQMLPMRRFGVEEETYWNYSFTPLRGEDGSIVGIFNSGSEITENVLQRRHSEALVELNQELQVCRSASDAMTLAASKVGPLLRAAGVEILERSTSNGSPVLSLGAEWREEGACPLGKLIELDRFSEVTLDAVMAGRTVSLSLADAELRPADRACLAMEGLSSLLAVPWGEGADVVSVLLVRSRDARPCSSLEIATAERMLETVMEWIERERSRERERVMAGEIDHRARNLLAIVRSIVRMTKGQDVDDVKAKLEDRFSALSRVHSLLGNRHWAEVTLRDLLDEELAPFGAAGQDRISLEGPTVMLGIQEAQFLAMLFHELAVNAAKYGSLGEETGHLSIAWSIDERRTMVLDWIESGVPPGIHAEAYGPETGFGSLLLKSVVQTQFGGCAQRTVRTDGIQHHFELSLGA